jgi:methanogenic corrinoid protein MtbC1
MYTIKQTAAQTGLNVPTIRAWERRYGVVQPARTPAGYRLYDDTAIARLMAMRRLVEDNGWRPRQASGEVLAAGDDLVVLRAIGRPQEADVRGGGNGTAPARGSERRERTGESIDAFLAATAVLDVPAMERVLDSAFADQRFEPAMRDVVFPALRGVGERWSAGEIDVAGEHAASETVRRRLAGFFQAAGRSIGGPAILVGLPPGSRHELGALAFAVAARRAGLDVVYLGADVPLESWLRAVRETGAPIVVLGVVTEADVASATVVAEGLRTLDRPPECFIGGALAGEVPVRPGFRRLPELLEAAVSEVAEALAR